jgi:citrate synthase
MIRAFPKRSALARSLPCVHHLHPPLLLTTTFFLTVVTALCRSKLPAHIEPMIRSFPKEMHPMTQFAAAVAAMQTESKFAHAYSSGVNKKLLWTHAYEDILDVIAKLPEVAALIYRCV